MKQTTETQEPEKVDVKWVDMHRTLKPALQHNLRKAGLLTYYIVPGTTKILYSLRDIDALIEQGKVS